MTSVSKPYQMRDRVTVEPAVEPVTLAELKDHLRITGASEDAYLSSLIVASRMLLEEWLKRKLIEQTLEGFLDHPGIAGSWWEGRIVAAISAVASLRVIQLPWAPTISVLDVALYSLDDEETIVDPASYRVDRVDRDLPSRITLKETVVWPGGSYRNQNSLRVRWKAGYGTAATDVPAPIRLALKMLAAHLYANRGECTDGDSCLGACGAKSIISTYRVMSV